MANKKLPPCMKKPTVDQSTGPVTLAGKEISSRNALKHGCTSSKTLILPTEDRSDFHALEALWFRTYSSQDEAERNLVHSLVEADWFLRRAARTYSDTEAQIFEQAPQPLDWTEDHHKSLARFLRYRTAHTNTFAKCRKAVEDYRRNRQRELSKRPLAQHKAERPAIAQAKLEIRRNKESHSVERGFDRWLDATRAEAEAKGVLL